MSTTRSFYLDLHDQLWSHSMITLSLNETSDRVESERDVILGTKMMTLVHTSSHVLFLKKNTSLILLRKLAIEICCIIYRCHSYFMAPRRFSAVHFSEGHFKVPPGVHRGGSSPLASGLENIAMDGLVCVV